MLNFLWCTEPNPTLQNELFEVFPHTNKKSTRNQNEELTVLNILFSILKLTHLKMKNVPIAREQPHDNED